MRMRSVGNCMFCEKEFSGSGMAKHLQSCSKRKSLLESEKGQTEIFLIKAKSGPFWIYFEVDALSTLGKVDSFLRAIWLECCGHLSNFKINGRTFASDPHPEFDDMGMDVQLIDVIRPGSVMLHEYDLGSTTRLDLKCISIRDGKGKKNIELIARNNIPDFECDSDCGKPAKNICSICYDIFCESCAKEHECDGECDEDVFLPVVNSPRMGVCGYGV